MIPLLSAAQMRDADRFTIETLGIPARVLMETAGRACADVASRHLAPRSRVSVVCGPGNNGGDGMVVTRVLLERRHDVHTLVVAARENIGGDALANLQALDRLGARISFASSEDEVNRVFGELKGSALVVDALFGTGLRRAVAGGARVAVDMMNGGACGKVLSVDIPSGIDSDTGATLGASVRADWTVALGAMKRGHALVPGADRCGVVEVADIGIPRRVIDATGGVAMGITLSDVSALHEARPLGAHKGSAGHVAIRGGSPGMTGAAVLACRGALRTGAGRVSLLLVEGAVPNALAPEVTAFPVTPETEAALLVDKRIDALVVGPGLAPDEAGGEALDRDVAGRRPIVLDAGALALLGSTPERLKARTAPTVLTPHPAELGRLSGISAAEVQEDRIGHAVRLAARSGAVVVLKGARTVIARPEGEIAVCMAGHPVLATGGTGDVLAGVVGALLGQGLSAWDAAKLGVVIHARAGERTSVERGPVGVLASEIADEIPKVIAELEA